MPALLLSYVQLSGMLHKSANFKAKKAREGFARLNSHLDGPVARVGTVTHKTEFAREGRRYCMTEAVCCYPRLVNIVRDNAHLVALRPTKPLAPSLMDGHRGLGRSTSTHLIDRAVSPYCRHTVNGAFKCVAISSIKYRTLRAPGCTRGTTVRHQLQDILHEYGNCCTRAWARLLFRLMI